MNIYLESVSVDEIANAAAAGLADGVAFSHVAFSADAPDESAKERLEEISRQFALPICVPVGAVTSSEKPKAWGCLATSAQAISLGT